MELWQSHKEDPKQLHPPWHQFTSESHIFTGPGKYWLHHHRKDNILFRKIIENQTKSPEAGFH